MNDKAEVPEQPEDERIKGLNIYQRINEVRKEVEYLKKEKAVQGYKVVTHDQVTGALRDSFIKYGIIVVPSEINSHVVDTGTTTSNGTPWIRYEAKYQVDFVNADEPTKEGEIVTVVVTAHAMDTGDKAPGKALSYGTKMAMLKLFSIETGEDDEERAEQVTQTDGLTPASLYKRFSGHMAALLDNIETVMAIKGYLLENNLERAAEEWAEIGDYKVISALSYAPTKGGCFTVDERKKMSSDEFKALMREHNTTPFQP